MDLRPNLLGQLKQSIVITPQIIQSIKLLKYGHDDLCAYLKDKEERNPLIEVVLSEPKVPEPKALHETKTPVDSTLPERVSRVTSDTPNRASAGGSAGGVSSARGNDLPGIEETFASTTTLREHLLHQIGLNIRGSAEQIVAAEIVESIEPDGYLRRDLDEIAFCLGVSEHRIEEVLALVQLFEPTGVGARNLAECLRLQLEEEGPLSPAMTVLLANLDIMASFNLPALARLCKVQQQDVMTMIHDIRQLEPRPGKHFDCEMTMPALPDVSVDVHADGSCHVELNSALLPKVLVNREYYAEMRAVATGEEDTRFVTDCMKDANWLTRNLDQRANTLLGVATELVKRQKDFFLHGVEHIKPLCQGDVADALDMHRSTVCRAISGKYMMTNRGLFELKFFFSNAVNATEGKDDFSAESIRAKIRHLIANEGSRKTLSDDAIMSILREEGVEIARRTVAKYREMMGIPPSSVRRRQQRVARIESQFCTA